MPAAVTKAQRGFDKITYTKDKGIQAYVRELQLISKHILLPIEEYSLQRRIVEAIPLSIRNHLIDFKSLSTSMSSVAEWVEAVAKRERELLEKAAFEDNYPNLKRFTPGGSSQLPPKRRQRRTAQPTTKSHLAPKPQHGVMTAHHRRDQKF